MLSQKLNESQEAPRDHFGLQEDRGNWRKLYGDKSGGIMFLLTGAEDLQKIEAGPGPRWGLNTADCDEELHSGGWWWRWWWGHRAVHWPWSHQTPAPAPKTDSNKPPQPTTHPIPGHSATHSTARHNFVAKKHHQQYNITTTQHDTIIAMPLQIPSNQSFLIYILSILCHLMACHHHISFFHANLHTDLCYGRFLVIVRIKADAANIIITMSSLSGQC